MPVLIVQQGHCYRKTGATGTEGEQGYATAVADACRRLLHGRNGWFVNPTLADENDYRGAAFVAVHCDGSIHSTARGASAGYRTPEGQAFAQAWQRAYAARGWPVFRPDNYTSALSGYYGTREAVEAGTRRAIIIECGFMTSPADRALLTAPGGPERVALAIGDALGIPQPQQEETEEMLILAKKKDSNEIWLGDGIFRRHISDMSEVTGLQYWMGKNGHDPTIREGWADLRVLGVDVTDHPDQPVPPPSTEIPRSS